MSNKYGAIPTVIDGIRFDSKAEARRYQELKLMERAGEIRGLICHQSFTLIVNEQKIGKYTADFSYFPAKEYGLIVEDVKGVRTRDYVLRRKLMMAIYGINIVEVS